MSSVRIDTLQGGLRVATDRMEQVETVSVGVYVGAGTRHEPKALNGVAHMLEHMAFKGTATRDAKAIAEEIENVGAFMNAHTGREQTAYYIKCLKEDVDLALDILSDIFLNSAFDPAEFERERGVILQELGQVEDTPDDVIFDRFQETAFPDQAIGRPVLGTADIIKTLPRAAALDCAQRHLRAGQRRHRGVGQSRSRPLPRAQQRTVRRLARGRAGERGARALSRRRVPRRQRSGTSASRAGLPRRGRARSRLLGRAGLRDAARRRDVVAPVPGNPREAGAVLFDLLARLVLRRRRRVRRLYRDGLSRR